MRTALVTGATGGLGQHIVRFLDSKGVRTVIHYNKREETACRLKDELKNVAYIIRCDISDYQAVLSMSEEVSRRVGPVDIIINNASITIDKLLIRYTEDEWDRVINTNLKGAFNVIRSFLPQMIEHGGGDIINISSYSGIRGSAGQAAYSASKAGLVGLTLSLSKELSVYNIKINALVPGYLPLGMGVRAREAMERAAERSARGGLSSPDDVVELIYFILKSRSITGQVFTCESRVGFNY
ncbi:MAG: SDR family oxidoreductase [Nitrospirae bacterium]|nr:SDR family oxidoreductase [Nitrospirota bacterium]